MTAETAPERLAAPLSPWAPSETLVAEIKRLVGALITERNAPGAAWGLFTRSGLAASGGIGWAAIGGANPNSQTVFRIASISKSFTAVAVLRLAEEGALRLDDPVVRHLPRFAATRSYSPDSPPITVADLLSMSSGLAADDPWADRLESLNRVQFNKLIGDGFRTVAAPGLVYEYSNTGYALLGAIVERLSGQALTEYVRQNILIPLDLQRTGYDFTAFSPPLRATGYSERDGRWIPEPFTAPGTYSAIGGLLSNVEDMARWAGWLAQGFPPGDDDITLLPKAARRAMATGHIDIPPVLRSGSTRGRLTLPERPQISSYGYGLFIDHDPIWGNIAHHSGGYPGFGTNLRWQIDSGIGVVVLANGRYARASVIAARALETALAEAGAAARTVRFWPETLAAQAAVTGELLAGRDPFALPIFADNVPLDSPWANRRADLTRALDQVGHLTPPNPTDAAGRAVRHRPAGGGLRAVSEAHIAWEIPAERGTLVLELQLTPQTSPLVQSLKIGAKPPFPATDLTTQTPIRHAAD
jgi:CubicO group peptidase (beta-lactamase class C family)